MSVSSELLRSRCFLELLEAFLELEPDSVLALSFVPSRFALSAYGRAPPTYPFTKCLASRGLTMPHRAPPPGGVARPSLACLHGAPAPRASHATTATHTSSPMSLLRYGVCVRTTNCMQGEYERLADNVRLLYLFNELFTENNMYTNNAFILPPAPHSLLTLPSASQDDVRRQGPPLGPVRQLAARLRAPGPLAI